MGTLDQMIKSTIKTSMDLYECDLNIVLKVMAGLCLVIVLKVLSGLNVIYHIWMLYDSLNRLGQIGNIPINDEYLRRII